MATGLGVHPTSDQLREQGWNLETVGPHVIIAATAEARALHGTRYFLENYLGVRWLAPGVTKTLRAVEGVLAQAMGLVEEATFYLPRGSQLVGH